jgi:hypothetical protein
MAVISAETSVSTRAMRPGTNRFTLSSVGLKRIRVSVAICTPPRLEESSVSYDAMTARA